MREIKAILAGTIYTPTEEIENGVILMDGYRISRVGPKHEIKIPAGAAVIDNQDRIVVPGFIDLHIQGAAGRCSKERGAESLIPRIREDQIPHPYRMLMTDPTVELKPWTNS